MLRSVKLAIPASALLASVPDKVPPAGLAAMPTVTVPEYVSTVFP
jgi:hypothetical protein